MNHQEIIAGIDAVNDEFYKKMDVIRAVKDARIAELQSYCVHIWKPASYGINKCVVCEAQAKVRT